MPKWLIIIISILLLPVFGIIWMFILSICDIANWVGFAKIYDREFFEQHKMQYEKLVEYTNDIYSDKICIKEPYNYRCANPSDIWLDRQRDYLRIEYLRKFSDGRDIRTVMSNRFTLAYNISYSRDKGEVLYYYPNGVVDVSATLQAIDPLCLRERLDDRWYVYSLCKQPAVFLPSTNWGMMWVLGVLSILSVRCTWLCYILWRKVYKRYR